MLCESCALFARPIGLVFSHLTSWCTQLEAFEREILFMKELTHPNIVRYLGTEVDAKKLYIFMEYCPGASGRMPGVKVACC